MGVFCFLLVLVFYLVAVVVGVWGAHAPRLLNPRDKIQERR